MSADVSLDVKMEFIIEERPNLKEADLRSMARIIYQHDKTKLNFSSVGARVLLHKLPPAVINSLYSFVQTKVAKS